MQISDIVLLFIIAMIATLAGRMWKKILPGCLGWAAFIGNYIFAIIFMLLGFICIYLKAVGKV